MAIASDHPGSPAAREPLDAIVVGAGFAGLYMVHTLRRLGMTVVALEAGSDVGGTWFWNRYPGARCDTESLFYSYSFSEELQQEWTWTERYAAQPEILAYLNHVAARFGLRRHIRFGIRVTGAAFDDRRDRWTVRTDHGEDICARFCIMATGALSVPRIPEFAGMDGFAGTILNTATWPVEGFDFSGKRVAVIGTGSSGIQVIPIVADQAETLHVFQRTPGFSVPARNRPLAAERMAQVRRDYGRYRAQARTGERSGFGDLDMSQEEHGAALGRSLALPPHERDAILEDYWQRGGGQILSCFPQTFFDEETNAEVAGFVRRKIRAIVTDPAVADLLSPTTYPIGTKRICVDTDYYKTFNRAHVSLVDLQQAPLERITPTGILAGGRAYQFDVIILATGFDAVTGALLSIDIRGAGGVRLRDKWRDGPRAYLGLIAAGFPNLFMVTGPGSPSVLSNVVVSIEQHVEWIGDCLAHMQAQGLGRIAADPQAEDAWVAQVAAIADASLFGKAASWYMGANIPGKARVFMAYAGGVGAYREICAQVAANGYEGLVLSAAPSATAPGLNERERAIDR